MATGQRLWKAGVAISAALSAAGCGERQSCPGCDRLVIAATGEPPSIFPPLVGETVGRDISDQIFERLADLRPGRSPIDSEGYTPRLAERWERVDSLTWRFHLRASVTWSDGQPVTAEDVAFSFQAFSDSTIDAAARPYLAGRLSALAEDPTTIRVTFRQPSAEQLYDATYHVRIIPKHVWAGIPRAAWATDTSLAHLIGSGPYKLAGWNHGQSLRLEANPRAAQPPRIRQVVWRFTASPDAALNLVLAGEADVLEALGPPDRVARAADDTALSLVRYPSAAYGFLGYQLIARDRAGKRAPSGGPHPLFGDRNVRRALNLAINRSTLATTIFGADSKAPPGPMSQLLWIWDDSIAVLPFDSSASARLLDQAGWRRRGAGIRARNGAPLAFDILVPGTSPTRKQIAEILQESWRRIGAKVSITAVDFPVFQQRLVEGAFDTYVGAWLDEPTPRGLADQWTRAGWGMLNYGHYANPVFDSLFTRATSARNVADARRAWVDALDTLNADAPAIFLYAPTNVAAVSRRVRITPIDPYSWLAGLSEWRVEAGSKGGS